MKIYQYSQKSSKEMWNDLQVIWKKFRQSVLKPCNSLREFQENFEDFRQGCQVQEHGIRKWNLCNLQETIKDFSGTFEFEGFRWSLQH